MILFKWFKDRRTWAMVQQRREMRSRTDYILGSNCRIFRNVTGRDPRHNSDHFVVMGCLFGASPRDHSLYLGQRTHLLLRMPVHQTNTRTDKIFAKLQRAIPNLDKRVARHNLWILEETWRLVSERFSAIRGPGRCQTRVRRLVRAILEVLKGDRQRRVDMARENVERLLTGEPPLPCKAWRRMG